MRNAIILLISLLLLSGCTHSLRGLVFKEVREVSDNRYVYTFEYQARYDRYTRDYVFKDESWTKILEEDKRYRVTYYFEDKNYEDYWIKEIEIDN